MLLSAERPRHCHLLRGALRLMAVGNLHRMSQVIADDWRAWRMIDANRLFARVGMQRLLRKLNKEVYFFLKRRQRTLLSSRLTVCDSYTQSAHSKRIETVYILLVHTYIPTSIHSWILKLKHWLGDGKLKQTTICSTHHSFSCNPIFSRADWKTSWSEVFPRHSPVFCLYSSCSSGNLVLIHTHSVPLVKSFWSHFLTCMLWHIASKRSTLKEEENERRRKF